MRYDAIACVVAALYSASFSEDSAYTPLARPANDVSINLFGDALYFSFSYERLFACNSWFFITGKVGVGYDQDFNISFWGGSPPALQDYLIITEHITGNFGKGICFGELGFGGSIIAGNTNYHFLYYPVVGFRLQPVKNKWRPNFRIFGCLPFSDLLKGYDFRKTDGTGPKPIFLPFGFSTGVCF
jgi:hypothetical protein